MIPLFSSRPVVVQSYVYIVSSIYMPKIAMLNAHFVTNVHVLKRQVMILISLLSKILKRQTSDYIHILIYFYFYFIIVLLL